MGSDKLVPGREEQGADPFSIRLLPPVKYRFVPNHVHSAPPVLFARILFCKVVWAAER